MTDEHESTAIAPRKALVQSGAEVGAFVPSSLDEVFRIAQAMSLSGLAPPSLNTPEKITVAILAGAELGLPPFQSVQSFAVINSRPTIWGDGMLAVIRSRGIRVREWTEGEDDGRVAHCEITRPDTGEIIERKFSVSDAKKAGLWGKAGPWQQYPGRMLQMRSRAFACRDGAADILRGFQMREEIEDYGATATPVGADGLKARLEAQKTSDEGYNAHAERVIDGIEPVQQEKARRTRRTRAQIDLDGRVAAFLAEHEDASAGDLAEALEAPLADVEASLARLGVERDADDDGERPTPQTSMDADHQRAEPEGEAQAELPLGESAPTAEAEQDTSASATPASPDSQDQEDSGQTQPSEPSSAGGDARDAGEPTETSQPSSDVSPGPGDLYRMALANAGDFATLRATVTDFRKTEAWINASEDEQADYVKDAVGRLSALHTADPAIPTPAENTWVFALWMPVSPNKDTLRQVFALLQQTPDWLASPQDRRDVIASAVEGRLSA
jgi:hypothetical protein